MSPLQQGMLDLTRLWLRGLRGDAGLAAIPGLLALLWWPPTAVSALLQHIADAFQDGDPQGRSALGVLAARIDAGDVGIGLCWLLVALGCHTVIIRRQWRLLDVDGLLVTHAGPRATIRAITSSCIASVLYLSVCLASFAPTPWLISTVARLQIPLLMQGLAALLLLSIAAIPAVWLSIRLLPLPYLAALRGGSPLDLLRWSWRLMRGRWWISSLFTAIPGTLYTSVLLLVPFLVLILTFWWLGGLSLDGAEVDHLHWLSTTISASRWLLWPMDALLLPMIHASCLVTLQQALQHRALKTPRLRPPPTSPT